MIPLLILCVYTFLAYFGSALRVDPEVYVRLGENIRFCCELNQEENQAIVLSHGSLRLRSLARMMKYKLIDANSQEFFDSHPGYFMKDLAEPVESLCLEKQNPGADLSDDNLKFQCDLYDEMGLGAIIATQIFTIRIYEPPSIATLPTQLESVVNGPVSLKCMATGRPDLKLRWINEATGELYAEEKAAPPTEGELELPLTLEKVVADQDGQRLICEATTSYPPDQNTARQFTEISVNYPPQIKFDVKPIYTALEAVEEIALTIHGKPKPDVQCDQMSISGPRELKELPAEKPGVNRYILHINGITEEDLGDHTCTATNKFGSARETITFTLAPSKPEVVSPAFSGHADYYLLGWRTKSKSPMRNATFQIRSFGSEQAVKEDARTVLMNDPMVAKGNTSSGEIQEFWHHLPNLSHNSEHQIHIRACNEHACTAVDHQIPDVTFRTMKEYSSNKIDPAILLKPPTASMRAAAFRDFNEVKDITLSIAASSLFTLIALTLTLNL